MEFALDEYDTERKMNKKAKEEWNYFITEIFDDVVYCYVLHAPYNLNRYA